MYKRNAQGWSKHFDFFVLDEVCLQLAFLLAYFLRHQSFAYASDLYREIGLVLVLNDALIIVLLNSFHNVLIRGYYVEFVETLKHCFYVFAFSLLFVFATQSGTSYSRVVLTLTFAFHAAFSYSGRLLWKRYVKKHGLARRGKKNMLVVLNPDSAEEMLDQLQENSAEGFRIVGIVFNGTVMQGEIHGVPVVADVDGAASYILHEWVDAVYVDCSSTEPRIAELMNDCISMGVPVHYHVPGVNDGSVKRFVERIGQTTVLTTSLNYSTPIQTFVKRAFDVLGGIVGSLLALIIMLLFGPFIRKESPGPILYRQTRVGKNGKRFQMYKIRSMYLDADERKKDFESQNRVKDGMMFKLDFDPRIIGNEILPDGSKKTGIGDFLRRTSLDEFPQFFNVLMGQMSLVGTRPPTIDEWERYEMHHRARLAVKPGITGLWQVSGRSDITDFEEVVRLDTEYIYNWNYGLDIKILLETVAAVFRGKGAM